MTEYRTQEHEIEIDARPEDVWAALTVPEEMKKWYVEDASLEPKQGGTYRVSWGPGLEAVARIETWDPPNHLRLVSVPPDTVAPANAPQTTEDFTIAVRGDRTVLRLTFDISAGADWDTFYDGTNLGWETCFAALRFMLEQHPGERVSKVVFAGRTDHEPRALWERVVGPDGILGALGAQGSRYQLVTPLGDAWSGTVQFVRPPSGPYGNFVVWVTVDEMDGAVFHVGAERHGNTLVYGGLILFGDRDAAAAKPYRDLVAERLELTELS